MLKVTELNTYLEECKVEIPEFTTVRLLVDDADFGKFSKAISKNDDGILLIAIIPTVNGSGNDEDNMKAINKLMFFAVRKEDVRGSYADELAGLQTCQDAILALFKKFIADHNNFDKRCMANNFNFNNWNIDPVNNYHQTNGWVLEIDLKTSM